MSNIEIQKPSPIRMINSTGGAFGFDCCLASPKFRVFQQPAKWQSGSNSALFALHVGETLQETHSSLPHLRADTAYSH